MRARLRTQDGAESLQFIMVTGAMALAVAALMMSGGDGARNKMLAFSDKVATTVGLETEGSVTEQATTARKKPSASAAQMSQRLVELADVSYHGQARPGSKAWQQKAAQVAKPYPLVYEASAGVPLYEGRIYAIGSEPRLLAVTDTGSVLEYEDGKAAEVGKAAAASGSDYRWRYFLPLREG